MDITWLKHRKAQVAHGFVQLGGVGVKPWIVSLCRNIRFRPGDLAHQSHDVFTSDMNTSPEDFCVECIKKFSMAASKPKLQMKWPSVMCPECGEKAWLTDSVRIIVCEHCNMNYAFEAPLYDKKPKVKVDDRQAISTERPRPTLVKRTYADADSSEIRDDGEGSDSVDGVEGNSTTTRHSDSDTQR